MTFSVSAASAELEPNNTRSQANALTLNSAGQAVTTARINPLTDPDFFSISLPPFVGAGTLIATMTPTSADHGLDAAVQLQSSSGTLLAERDVGFDDAPEVLSYPSAAGGSTYFIACRSTDFADAGSGDYSLSIQLLLPRPNLAPYQPSGWADKIVVSKAPGNNTNCPGLTATNTLYLDFAVVNAGTAGVSNRFLVSLFVDGVSNRSWFVDPPLAAGFFVGLQDHPLEALAPGSHTLKVVVDSMDAIPESSESDNEFTRTIAIADDDPNDSISGALMLAAADRTTVVSAAIDTPTDVDMFAVIVVAGQRLRFDIDGSAPLDSYLRLFDSSGNEVASNNDRADLGEPLNGDSFLEHTFATGGTYVVGVSGFGNSTYNPLSGTGDTAGSTGSFRLTVSPGIAGSIRKPADSNNYPVDILRFGSTPMPIATNQRTWIVVHGWNSAREKTNIYAATKALFDSRPGDQILTLDWSSAADTGILDPFSAEDGIVPVAQWAATALLQYGFSGTNLNLVGHSFGSYVSDEIAQRIPGGVHTIVTLDPAANVLGGYDPTVNDEVNFAEHSFYSWSFHSSSLAGNESTPTTADEAFVVKSDASPIDAHGNILFLFAYFLLHPTDVVGQLFLLGDLLSGNAHPWLPDQFYSLDGTVKGYEAIIDTSNGGLIPSTVTFVSLPSVSISRSNNGVAIVWPAAYSNFVLQSTTTLDGNAGSWTNVVVQPSTVGQSRVLVLPKSDGVRLFRLRLPSN